MKRSLITLLFLMTSILEVKVHAAQEAVVIEVRKNISLSKKDPVYKNFFINGGSLLGLKKGKIVDVLRRVPVHDPILNKSIGDLKVKVAELEIIHADATISVARLLYQETPEERPLLEYESVMIGDRLDLASIRSRPNLILKGPTPEVAKN